MQDHSTRWSTSVLVVIGLLTIMPFTYMLAILVTEGEIGLEFEELRMIHFAVMALYAGLLVFYVREAIVNSRVPADRRALWSVLNVVFGPVAQIVFFTMYMLPRRHLGSSS